MSASTTVDLPAPGLPVTPSTKARPVCGYTCFITSTAPGRPSSRSRMRRALVRTSPASTALAVSTGSAAKQLPRDHHALHLVGPLADLAQLAVAQRALDGKLARVAVAAVDLHRAIAGAHAGLRGVELGH